MKSNKKWRPFWKLEDRPALPDGGEAAEGGDCGDGITGVTLPSDPGQISPPLWLSGPWQCLQRSVRGWTRVWDFLEKLRPALEPCLFHLLEDDFGSDPLWTLFFPYVKRGTPHPRCLPPRFSDAHHPAVLPKSKTPVKPLPCREKAWTYHNGLKLQRLFYATMCPAAGMQKKC